MRESVTYREIVAEGEAIGEAKGQAMEARRALVIAGSRRLGDPDEAIRGAIEAIHSVERLERLLSRLFDVESWDDLLQ